MLYVDPNNPFHPSIRLLTQSPSSRLSHLANRRKIFSSANLKSTSATTSHKTFANSKQLLIDKS